MYHHGRTKSVPLRVNTDRSEHPAEDLSTEGAAGFYLTFCGELEFDNCLLVMVTVSKDVSLSACKRSGLAHGGLMDGQFRNC